MTGGLVDYFVTMQGIEDPVDLVRCCQRAIDAWRGIGADAFRRVSNVERSRLTIAAGLTTEKLRDAADKIYSPEMAASMVETILPAMEAWLAVAGRDVAAARTEAERIISEYCEESARGVAALLAARRPSSTVSLLTEVEALLERWRPRAHRLEERLARELEGAVAVSWPPAATPGEETRRCR